MENNKPDWLKKAEQEIKEFKATKIGQMTQKEFIAFERNSKGGSANKETGHIYKLIESNGDKNIRNAHKLIKCEVCSRPVTTANYAKWHGNKCQHNKKMEVLNSLPKEFTRTEMRNKLKEFGYPESWLCMLKDSFFTIQTYKGTSGSNVDVSKFKKKEGL